MPFNSDPSELNSASICDSASGDRRMGVAGPSAPGASISAKPASISARIQRLASACDVLIRLASSAAVTELASASAR